ncbi:branched-chain-amino-acid aminotransferase, mitochondrial isoform X3 [Carettochelys insculpta]|uniref:branched-chain-amino-acid aminotransferase, mitochondrial isoform X3 n=1 Tax=Carettochelys insculpta TaxID=44489 RepID=UPI003EC14A5B
MAALGAWARIGAGGRVWPGGFCAALNQLLSCRPRRPISTFFKASDLQVELTKWPKPKPALEELRFGKHFTDHMLSVEWSQEQGWGQPHIRPFQNLSLHPATSSLHYAVMVFEGMKAFRGDDQEVRLFRPQLNMERMYHSATRASLPPTLGVFRPSRALLYVILSPVGAYFSSGPMGAVRLLADPRYVRAWPGGVGNYKMGGNYAPTILVQDEAVRAGCQQVLWLYGADHQITEAGTMNLFLFWTDPQGDLELVTPPLSGLILPGVTRQSLLDLGRQWGEFKVSERSITMADLLRGLQEKRVRELFGCGTACVISPISHILYQGQNYPIPTMENGPQLAQRFLKELMDIQYGRVPSNWVLPV